MPNFEIVLKICIYRPFTNYFECIDKYPKTKLESFF